MKNPVIADTKPVKVELTEGEEYYFCTCGKSKNQPFCDGSHAGTGFKPKSFVAEETGDAYLCRCKYSNNLPFVMAPINSLRLSKWVKKVLMFISKRQRPISHLRLLQPKKSPRSSSFIN